MLRQFVAQKPGEAFPRYGLAMELKRRGQLAEAIVEFRELIAKIPEYVPAYLMAGNTLVEAGDRDGALQVLDQGVQAARAAGDAHALGELESARTALEG
ncbi:tetratricopeptide repeat protein [Nannocystis pusilla]|uniref:tetratricopeptide repeat protein n=1 Tax=Nannocystis pusilla TaxID=889268 RepID=UPI003DA59583